MRAALPNAAFIGFTGTPLIAGEEERTREVFGDYVSIYDFAQSVADGATVPLYYESRLPELQLTNKELGDEIARVIDEANLGEDDEDAIARRFATQYHLITNEDRLEKSPPTLCAISRGAAIAARRCSSRSTRRPRSACTIACRGTWSEMLAREGRARRRDNRRGRARGAAGATRLAAQRPTWRSSSVRRRTKSP